MSLNSKAKELVKELLSSGNKKYSESFPLYDTNGKATGNEVYIIVVRRSKGEEPIQLSEVFNKTAHSLMGISSGTQCPRCKGSGVVD